MPAIRSRIIRRLYGDGVAAMIAAAATDRAIHQLRASIRKEPEVLDVSRLVPGETYQIITRPAPSRRLRKREAELADVEHRLDKLAKSARGRRRSARRAAKADRLASRRIELAAEVDRRQQKALARARGKGRSPRRVEFR